MAQLGGCGGESEEDNAVESGAGAGDRRPNIVVILTDDQGYADLGVQGIAGDVRTPHIDQLASQGVRFTDGYVTAPVCAPSRAGLLLGRYQQRYGLETNYDLPIALSDPPMPERLRRAGYRTGIVGKLHLPTRGGRKAQSRRLPGDAKHPSPAAWGFQEYFVNAGNFRHAPRDRFSTHDLEGHALDGGAQWLESSEFRTDAETKAALQFIERNREHPFFLYVAYFSPHVPLEAPSRQLSPFSDVQPEARRYALAMLAAVDDGVGRIVAKLSEHGIEERTLIFFVSDNGAPLVPGLSGFDSPIAELKRWNGSLNAPFRGEKDMLLEGGIRVPFVARWTGVLPPATIYREPVSTLDVAATALAVAGIAEDESLDGTNLVPYLTGQVSAPPHDALFWAIGGQAAIRKGRWKWLKTHSSGQFLFDLDEAMPERRNLAATHPKLAAKLDAELGNWLHGLERRGVVREKQLRHERRLFHVHLR